MSDLLKIILGKKMLIMVLCCLMESFTSCDCNRIENALLLIVTIIVNDVSDVSLCRIIGHSRTSISSVTFEEQ